MAASFTVTLAIYEVAVRRWRITRLLLGMKTREPTRAGVTVTAAWPR